MEIGYDSHQVQTARLKPSKLKLDPLDAPLDCYYRITKPHTMVICGDLSIMITLMKHKLSSNWLKIQVTINRGFVRSCLANE